MKKSFQNYFDFSRREFNGLLTLLFLLALLYFIPTVMEEVLPTDNLQVSLQSELEKLSFEPNMEVTGAHTAAYTSRFKKNRIPNFHPFDPNNLSLEGWMQFGLSVNQARSIVNYRNKGGVFYKPQDLEKIYVISKDLYVKLLPFVQIQSRNQPSSDLKNKSYSNKIERKELVNINTADTVLLTSIKGIGPTFARRIYFYRNRLGGFHKSEQLLEVFGIDSTNYNVIAEQIFIDYSEIKKININLATYEDLKTFPYLKSKEIAVIIQYRKQHGNYKELADMQKVLLLNKETIDKIQHYIQF